MPLFPESAYQLELPKMHKVLQKFDITQLKSVEETVHAEMHKKEISSLVKPEMRIAMAVGSRGIQNLALIVKTIADELQNMGAMPFIVAAHADLIIPIGRVKPHTDFRGPIESGLCKMLTIGLGKFEGCTRLHHMGAIHFPTLLPVAAKLVIDKTPVGFGVAIIENSYDQTYHIEMVPADKIHDREPELLKIARSKMPKILVKEIDALIVQEMGKDISGAGMDPNIIGRAARGRLKDFDGPEIQRILVKSLTKDTHGNASGIGLADYVLKSCAETIDLGATYTNSVSCGNPEGGRIPIQVMDVKEGVLACLRSGVGVDLNAPKIVYIKNTLQLGEIWVSDALIEEVRRNPQLILCDEEQSIEKLQMS